MDVRLQGNSQFHYGVNGGAHQNSRHVEDNALRFLSQEEQECLQFFEETIDSLEESLEEDDKKPLHVKPPKISCHPVTEVDGPHTSSPNPVVTVSSHQDIIDLVHPEPDLVHTKEPMFNPTNPDFQRMLPNPEWHFEVKPKHDSLSSEYNPPLPSGSYGPTDSHSSYHPPGSIPTPVLIAQKIAENQGGGSSNFHPSSMLQRLSLESLADPTDVPVKQGPPTSAKPTRFPANISVIHSGKEHQRQNKANVNIHERREQMLANLSTNHPLLQENSQQAVLQKTRNTPTRSISFKDPTPDKSRLEALSKLGLNRNRAMSGGVSLQITPNSTSLDPPKGPDTSSNSPGASISQTTQSSINLPESNVPIPPTTHIYVDRKPEILQTYSPRSHDDTSSQLSSSPPTFSQNRSYPPPIENKASTPPQAEVSSLEFNNYGGKSIVVNPSVCLISEPTTSPSSPEPKILPPPFSNPSEHNAYGGKTKVMTVAPVAMPRTNLPDILSSHIDKSQVMPTKPELQPTELNSYGGKSRSFNTSTGVGRASGNTATSFKAPAPTPAPRPPRHSYHGALTPQKTATRASSPEHKRRSNSLFRPQGITVQFSGRGAMNESRREALRKLGLLKD